MSKNNMDREFNHWYEEMMIWLMGIVLFATMAVIFEIKTIVFLSLVCAIVLCWRLYKLQRLYNYYKTNLNIMRECFSDVAIFTWVSAFHTVLVSGNSQMLVDDWVPMSETMTREQLEVLLGKITETVENKDEKIYKIRVSNRDKYIQIRYQRERGMQVYILSDVTDMITNKAELISYTYYDMATKLLSKDALVKKVEELMVSHPKYGGYAFLEISGVDRATTQQKEKINAGLDAISKLIKRHEQNNSVVCGRISKTRFALYYVDTNEIDAYKRAVGLSDEIIAYLESFNELNNTKLRFAGGFAHFPAQGKTYAELVSKVDFALFEATSQRLNRIIEFSDDVYAEREEKYMRVQTFNRIINGNLFDYQFQPIVSAHNGEIFAFEALMRPRTDVPMTPSEIIAIAKEEGRLSEVEHLTFSNTMRILNENQDIFASKKMFINSIPDCYVPDEYFEQLIEQYGPMLDRIVVEITEEHDLSDQMDEIIKKRYRNHNIMVALDDFGSGYANESNLLRCQPDFVKIDRSLIVDLDKDSKKQHLVGNIVSYASQHGIKVIAEGIETDDELRAAIELNVDLIQGFCTSKPRSVMLLEISQEVTERIITLNKKAV